MPVAWDARNGDGERTGAREKAKVTDGATGEGNNGLWTMDARRGAKIITHTMPYRKVPWVPTYCVPT